MEDKKQFEEFKGINEGNPLSIQFLDFQIDKDSPPPQAWENKGGNQSDLQGTNPQQPFPQQNFPQHVFPQQAFPQQAFLHQGYPQQAFHQHGFPQQAFPPQGYVQQAFPHQNFTQQGFPQQGFPQQGFPQQGFPQQGLIQQGFPQQGFPQQGLIQQGFPQQGFVQQPFPQQAFKQEAFLNQPFPQQVPQSVPPQIFPQQAFPQPHQVQPVLQQPELPTMTIPITSTPIPNNPVTPKIPNPASIPNIAPLPSNTNKKKGKKRGGGGKGQAAADLNLEQQEAELPKKTEIGSDETHTPTVIPEKIVETTITETPIQTCDKPEILTNQPVKSKKKGKMKGTIIPLDLPIKSLDNSDAASNMNQSQITEAVEKLVISPLPVPEKFEKHKVSLGLKIPKKIIDPKAKRRGVSTIIETNHLEIKLNKFDEVIHYDVEILPEKPKKLMVPVMTSFLKKYFPTRHPAFDGNKNLYSSGPLFPQQLVHGSVDITEDDRDTPTNFKVKVQYAARIDLKGLFTFTKGGGSTPDPPQSSIQCLDVVLRHSSHHKYVKVCRSFFSPPVGKVHSLGGGLELWYGHFQSAIIGWKPFLNVDVAHKGFSKHQNVVDLIGELETSRVPAAKSGNYLDYGTISTLRKFIKSLKVEYQIPKQSNSRRTYRVNDVLDSADRLTFEIDGKVMTIVEYFRKDRNYNIRYPKLPCLSVGNKAKKIYYPVELCTVLGGQNVIMKMDGNQTTNLIREAATPAYERKKKIEEIIRKGNYENDEVVKDFGIFIEKKFERINARILEAPKLAYKAGKPVITPNNGVWTPSEFLSSANLERWSILILDRIDISKVKSLIEELKINGKKLGMNINPPMGINFIQLKDLMSCLQSAAQDELQLVLVIVNASKNDYAQVKQISELQYGVLTQCIQGKTVTNMKPATSTMLLQKINSKLDAQNHRLHISSRPQCLATPCMIVGADVTHPSPGQEEIPSIAAVAASHDPSAYKYNITLRIQPANTEIITNLAEMIKEQLIYFYKSTNHKPEKIVMFRDGVSEGQFEQVLNAELTAIRSACTSLNASYKPAISMFIVQKRHHTRFFPTDPRNTDKKGNAAAGTCVDTVITHPTEIDFYLLSHASIQGTARPTKYHCIWDDSNMNEDEVEHLAYYLCHLYSRCTRAVSYPTPTYYAHLAAARARVLTENVKFNMNNLNGEQDRLKICDKIKQFNPMFFV